MEHAVVDAVAVVDQSTLRNMTNKIVDAENQSFLSALLPSPASFRRNQYLPFPIKKKNEYKTFEIYHLA